MLSKKNIGRQMPYWLWHIISRIPLPAIRMTLASIKMIFVGNMFCIWSACRYHSLLHMCFHMTPLLAAIPFVCT